MTKFLMILFAIMLFLGLHGEAAVGQTIVLGTDEIYPRCTPEGTGFVDLIIKEAFRRIGINDIQIIPLPSERVLINANEGIDDGITPRIAGLEEKYPNLIRVQSKIYNFDFTAFTKNADISIAKWEDLIPYNVAIVNGWQYPENHMPQVKSLQKVRTDEMLFKLMANNRIDVIIHELIAGKVLIKNMGLSGIVAQIQPLASPEMFLYLNKRHADLVPQLSEALAKMDAEGMRQGIIDKVVQEVGIK